MRGTMRLEQPTVALMLVGVGAVGSALAAAAIRPAARALVRLLRH
jgi:hypothetical protein